MRVSQNIALNRIVVLDRLRPVNPDQALLLAAGMAEEGLKTPIEVRSPNKKGMYTLVTGGHRLAAAKLLEWTEIEAEVLTLTPDEARLREINENIYRADLTELDRAVFLAEKKRLYEKLNPQAQHGGDRRSDQVAIFGHLIPRFTEEVSDRLGYSERTLRRVIARAALSPDARNLLAASRFANIGSELDALVRLDPDQQLTVARALVSGMPDAPANVATAIRVLAGNRLTVVSDADAQLDALMKTWRRAGAAARSRFLDHLAAQGEFQPATPAQDAA